PTTVADVRSRVADVRSRHLFIVPIPATSSRYSGMLIGPQWIVERVLVSESLWKFGTRLVFQFIATSEAVPELGSRTDGPPETRVGKSRRRDRGRAKLRNKLSVGDFEHDLAECFAGLELAVRFGSLSELQHLVDDRREFTSGNHHENLVQRRQA